MTYIFEESEKSSAIYFYTNFCKSCKFNYDIFEEVAKIMEGMMDFYVLDCVLYNELYAFDNTI